ncbi:glucose-1-phosphate cytidylyltransferase [Candidatus Pelagibacter ubique]|nr:glucose-1-phosphate cytidylyltransferase [Candidatus Pelagibacter ubique]
MKVVILAGGKGTRLSEETDLIPKPMSLIGGMPVIWHIIKIFNHFGYKEFIILAGYKSYKIKEFFENLYRYKSSIEIDLKKNSLNILDNLDDDLNIKIIETGEESQTGGRILRAKKYIGTRDFFLTYGDCLADININKLLESHKNSKKIATVTAVNPQTPYGALTIKNNLVTKFQEKPITSENQISGGFFIFKKEIFKLLKNDFTVLEKQPLENLVKTKNLNCYRHNGFWHPMDSLRDKRVLEKMWNNNKAPWMKLVK